MKDDRLVDEFLLHGLFTGRYITGQEAKLLKEYPLDFSTPWWNTERELSLHMDYLIDKYGGDKCLG